MYIPIFSFSLCVYVFNCVHPGTQKKTDSELHIFAVHVAHRQALAELIYVCTTSRNIQRNVRT